MNSYDKICSAQECPTSGIDASIGTLSSLVHRLFETTNDLESRLSAVLKPQETAGNSAKNPVPSVSRSPIQYKLYEESEALRVTIDRLRDVLERLDC
jgi:hypothetical protein